MIRTADALLATHAQPLDADYLFDNFDDCCEIEFASRPQPDRQPTVVKNLLALFDQAAVASADASRGQKAWGRPRSKEPKKPRASNERKKKKRDASLNQESMKKKLRLNLQDVFGQDARLLKKPAHPETLKSGTAPGTAKHARSEFVRAKTDAAAASASHLLAEPPARAQGLQPQPQPPRAKAKLLPKSSSLRLAGVFDPKDLQTIKRIVGKNASKPSLGPADPATGSTRLHQTSSRHGSNKRSCSFFETDDKSRHQQSFRNLRGDSIMISGNIHSILSSSKNLHYKLLKKKDARARKPPAPKEPDPPGRRGPSAGKSAGRDPAAAQRKPEPSAPGKKAPEAASKYYIPAHLGAKGCRPAKQQSFAHSEDFSGPARSTYLHGLLFPRLLSKAPAEEAPRRASRPKKPR